MINIPMEKFEGPGSVAKNKQAYIEFAEGLIEIQSGLEEKMGARDWCYYLEDHGLLKPYFDKVEKLIGDLRKDGHLPIDFTLADEGREVRGNQGVTEDYDIEDELQWMWERDEEHLLAYTPFNWVSYQEHYVEVLVEKLGLIGLFRSVAKKYHVGLSNGRGDTDINSIASMHRRFQNAEARGQKPVLLYCGDHDPKGIKIDKTLLKRFDNNVYKSFTDGYTMKPINLKVVRFGLNAEDIDRLNLSKIDNLLTGAKPGTAMFNIPLDAVLKLDRNGKRISGHVDHFKPYVQDYLRDHGAWKCEANALMTERTRESGKKLFEDALLPYIDLEGMKKFETENKHYRGLLKDTMHEFFQEKLDAA